MAADGSVASTVMTEGIESHVAEVEPQTLTTEQSEAVKQAPQKTTKPKRPKRPNYNHIHRNLLPLEIHPLPVLIPHNPLSLLAIALSYLAQVLKPPSQSVYDAYFSSATSSIHVTDAKTARRLWEMGFFGKGSLSRSEPTWLETQRKKGETSEEAIRRRREERRQVKLERAKKEREAIAKKLEDEGQLEDPEQNAEDTTDPQAADVPDEKISDLSSSMNGHSWKPPEPRLNDIATVLESATSTPVQTPDAEDEKVDNKIDGFDEWKNALEANGMPTPPPTSESSDMSHVNGHAGRFKQKIKCVRFSPTIEAREFDLSSPVMSPIKSPGPSPIIDQESPPVPLPENKEHLQLSQEEAFFLVYALGVLRIYSDDSDTVLPSSSLLPLFRRHSYFPPRSLSVPAEPDDPFMLSYAAYHHYRSLGWVVRSGVKFSIDYLLYNRGPAFSHAEFAVVLLPSYSHEYWSETEEKRQIVAKKTSKNWWWLHGINRVQAQVMKTLVLCYVDVPPPLGEEEKSLQDDISKLFARYRVRDINVKRWTPNRSRD